MMVHFIVMLRFFCCIIYMLYDRRECKGNSSEDDLCGQLNALESPVKL